MRFLKNTLFKWQFYRLQMFTVFMGVKIKTISNAIQSDRYVFKKYLYLVEIAAWTFKLHTTKGSIVLIRSTEKLWVVRSLKTLGQSEFVFRNLKQIKVWTFFVTIVQRDLELTLVQLQYNLVVLSALASYNPKLFFFYDKSINIIQKCWKFFPLI